MPMAHHVWWRGRGLTWRRPESLTADRAGPAAPPILARHCRALIRGTAEPNKTDAASPGPRPALHCRLPSLPFLGRLPPSSSSCKVMTRILFSFEWWIVYYEWELSLGEKLCLETMVYGLKEDISLILSILRLII